MTRRLACAALWVPAALGGCVASDAGKRDVARLVAERSPGGPLSPSDGAREATRLLAHPLDAERAARVALLLHPGVGQALAEVGIARAELVEALRLPNPEVEAELRFGGHHRATELGLTLDVLALALLPLHEGAARDALDARALQAASVVLDVAQRARLGFVRAVSARRGRVLAQDFAEAAFVGAELARELHVAGNVTDLQLAVEEAFLEEARLALARTRLEEAEAEEQLRAALGLAPDATLALPDSLPAPPAEELDLAGLEAAAVARSLALTSSERRAEAARRRAASQRVAGILPELRGGVSAAREEVAWSVGPKVSLALPLMYQGQGAVDRAVAEEQAARKERDALALQVRAAARSLAGRLTLARATEKHVREVLLPLRRRIVEATQLEYNAMAVGAFQLLAARRAQTEAEQAHREALAEYWAARFGVEHLRVGGAPPHSTAPAPRGAEPSRRPSHGH